MASGLPLDPRRRRADAPAGRARHDAPPGVVRGPRRPRLGDRAPLRRLGLPGPRVARRRARQLPHARDRRDQRLRARATRTARRASSSTRAATAARAWSKRAEGQVRRRIQCPYHAWSYGLDGSLAAAPHMDAVEDFDRSCFGLIEVRSAVVAGLLLWPISAAKAPDPVEHVGDLGARLAGWKLSDLRRAGSRPYEVEANWKAIGENYNECLHCPGVHPELNALSDYRSGNSQSGAGRVVRRLDGAQRGRRDDGPQRPRAAPADRGPRPGRAFTTSTTSRSSRTR